jgi:hypothetical protein
MNPVLGFGGDNPKRKVAGVTPKRFWFAKPRRSCFRLVKTGRNGGRAGSVSDGLTHLTELPQELSASKRSREGRRQSPASFSGRRVSVLLRGGVVKFSLKLRTG